MKTSYALEAHALACGTLRKEGSRLSVACADGFIFPDILQIEGKKAMDSRAFANGLQKKEIVLGKKD
jgi:hypothetical protein